MLSNSQILNRMLKTASKYGGSSKSWPPTLLGSLGSEVSEANKNNHDVSACAIGWNKTYQKLQ